MNIFIETDKYLQLYDIENHVPSDDLFTPLTTLTYKELVEQVEEALSLGRDIYTNQISIVGDESLRKHYTFDIMVRNKDKKWVKFEPMGLPAFYEEEVLRKMIYIQYEEKSKN